MRFQGFQQLYQQFRKDSPRLTDTFDRIHDYLSQLSEGFNNLANDLLVIRSLSLTYTGTFGIVGEDFVLQLVGDGGVQPYTYALIDPAPPGLVLVDDLLQGTPTTDGTYTFRAQVTDDVGATAVIECAVVIAPPGAAHLAPNITSVTLSTLTWQFWAHRTIPVFSGDISIPADIGTLAVIYIWARNTTTKQLFELVRYEQVFVGGTPFHFTGWNADVQQTDTNQTNWELVFECYNNEYRLTPGAHTEAVSIPGHSITTFSALEYPLSHRWQSPDGANRTVIALLIECSNYPQLVTVESISPQYGRVWYGWFTITGSTVLSIGAENSGTDFFPPTAAAENVTFYGLIGDIPQEVDLSGSAGVSSSVVTVQPPGVFIGTDATASAITTNSVITTGGAKATVFTVDFYLPLSDPKFWFMRFTLQTGRYVGGVWTPGGANGIVNFPGVTGTPMGDYAGPTAFYEKQDHSAIFSLIGSIQPFGVLSHVQAVVGPFNVPTPDEVNIVYKYRYYIATRRGTDGMGTLTLGTEWPGHGSELDVTVNPVDGKILGAHVVGAVALATSASLVPWGGVTGPLDVGGGGSAQALVSYKDASGNVIAWTGKKTISGVDYYGIWGANIWIGGTDPTNPKAWIDGSGNFRMKGYIETGSFIKIDTSVGFVQIDNSIGGVLCQDTGAGLSAQLLPSELFVYGTDGHSSIVTKDTAELSNRKVIFSSAGLLTKYNNQLTTGQGVPIIVYTTIVASTGAAALSGYNLNPTLPGGGALVGVFEITITLRVIGWTGNAIGGVDVGVRCINNISGFGVSWGTVLPLISWDGNTIVGGGVIAAITDGSYIADLLTSGIQISVMHPVAWGAGSTYELQVVIKQLK